MAPKKPTKAAGSGKKSAKRTAVAGDKPVYTPPAKGSPEEPVMFVNDKGKRRMVRRKELNQQ